MKRARVLFTKHYYIVKAVCRFKVLCLLSHQLLAPPEVIWQPVDCSQNIPYEPWGFGSGLSRNAIPRVCASEQALYKTALEVPSGCDREGLQNSRSFIFLQPGIVRDASQLLCGGYMFQGYSELGAGNGLAHHDLIRTGLAHNGATLDHACTDACIIYVKRLSVAQRHRRQERRGRWRQQTDCSFRRIDARV